MAEADIAAFVNLVRRKNAQELGSSFAAVNRLNMFDMLTAFAQLTSEETRRVQW